MYAFIKTSVAALVSAVMLSAPACAIPSEGAASDMAAAQWQAGPDFLSQALVETRSSAQDEGANPFDEPPAFVQSGPARRNPLSQLLRGNSDLALWNLVAFVRAHQEGHAFDLIDTSVAALPVGEPPAAVPLPGAVWLFVMGLLGLAGTRLNGASGKHGVAERRASASGLGAPVPA